MSLEAHQRHHRYKHKEDHPCVAQVSGDEARKAGSDQGSLDQRHVHEHPGVHRDDHLGQVTDPLPQIQLRCSNRWISDVAPFDPREDARPDRFPEPQSDHHDDHYGQQEQQEVRTSEKNGEEDQHDDVHRQWECADPVPGAPVQRERFFPP